MKKEFWGVYKNELPLLTAASLLIFVSLMMLRSLAPYLFPQYFFVIGLGVVSFLIFSQIDFEVLASFYKHIYVVCIVLLIVPLLIGQVTRGVTRWIQIGGLTLQTAEIVRPFIILFFAVYLNSIKLSLKNLLKATLLAAIPVILIIVQPSLGVSILALAGIVGVFLSLDYNKKALIYAVFLMILSSPLAWLILAPYQKSRIIGLLNPTADPTGAGYNRIQSIIAAGSGQLTGRGLGEGIQTQLAFLPERHTDFIFASIGEEFGFIGISIITFIVFFILYRTVVIIENSRNIVTRSFASGIFLTLFIQIIVHMGMNLGLLPITGLPLPYVSAGGSSFVSSMIMLGMLLNIKTQKLG